MSGYVVEQEDAAMPPSAPRPGSSAAGRPTTAAHFVHQSPYQIDDEYDDESDDEDVFAFLPPSTADQQHAQTQQQQQMQMQQVYGMYTQQPFGYTNTSPYAPGGAGTMSAAAAAAALQAQYYPSQQPFAHSPFTHAVPAAQSPSTVADTAHAQPILSPHQQHIPQYPDPTFDPWGRSASHLPLTPTSNNPYHNGLASSIPSTPHRLASQHGDERAWHDWADTFKLKRMGNRSSGSALRREAGEGQSQAQAQAHSQGERRASRDVEEGKEVRVALSPQPPIPTDKDQPEEDSDSTAADAGAEDRKDLKPRISGESKRASVRVRIPNTNDTRNNRNTLEGQSSPISPTSPADSIAKSLSKSKSRKRSSKNPPSSGAASPSSQVPPLAYASGVAAHVYPHHGHAHRTRNVNAQPYYSYAAQANAYGRSRTPANAHASASGAERPTTSGRESSSHSIEVRARSGKGRKHSRRGAQHAHAHPGGDIERGYGYPANPEETFVVDPSDAYAHGADSSSIVKAPISTAYTSRVKRDPDADGVSSLGDGDVDVDSLRASAVYARGVNGVYGLDNEYYGGYDGEGYEARRGMMRMERVGRGVSMEWDWNLVLGSLFLVSGSRFLVLGIWNSGSVFRLGFLGTGGWAGLAGSRSLPRFDSLCCAELLPLISDGDRQREWERWAFSVLALVGYWHLAVGRWRVNFRRGTLGGTGSVFRMCRARVSSGCLLTFALVWVLGLDSQSIFFSHWVAG
ncbi:hypothetical protein CPB84DRAFT_1743011 [Gymnopilus junonius]|uniref:Uncharacterized protein n=1 Tax=Gymnopilus junonius TaxID=109634 RepID=A0A9P5P1N0_GYMJU|nr:hypothetical protein CPB84DRAFT_1743011 [Gymnopilus junonius]